MSKKEGFLARSGSKTLSLLNVPKKCPGRASYFVFWDRRESRDLWEISRLLLSQEGRLWNQANSVREKDKMARRCGESAERSPPTARSQTDEKHCLQGKELEGTPMKRLKGRPRKGL